MSDESNGVENTRYNLHPKHIRDFSYRYASPKLKDVNESLKLWKERAAATKIQRSSICMI
jgi:hypothetical protein